jgi:hypothetical protein
MRRLRTCNNRARARRIREEDRRRLDRFRRDMGPLWRPEIAILDDPWADGEPSPEQLIELRNRFRDAVLTAQERPYGAEIVRLGGLIRFDELPA